MDYSPIYENAAAVSPIPGRRDAQGRDLDLAMDQLCALLATEVSYQVRSIPCRISLDERVTTEDWRRKICQWSYRVIDSFRLDRSIVSVAMNLLDRFLLDYEIPMGSTTTPCCPCISCKRSFDSRTFQLASMACLYIAIKANPEVESEEEAERRRNFRLGPFVDFSRGLFSQDDVLEMERVILHTIRWKVNPPTATSFVPYLIDLLPPQEMLALDSRQCYPLVQQVLRELARYLSELAVCLGNELAAAKPSQVAFASLIVSMELLTYQALPPSARTYFCDAFLRLDNSCHPEHIETIRCRLMATLWPEMLLDSEHAQTHDAGHPIALARYYGLLDLSQIQKQPQDASTPPSSPSRNQKYAAQTPKSPVSISSAPTY